MEQSKKLAFATFFLATLLGAVFSCSTALKNARQNNSQPHYAPWANVSIDSLDRLSVNSLRARSYGSELRVLEQQADSNAYIASYSSDGMRVYSRIDVPHSLPPKSGFPVIIYVHGWVGIDNAPGMSFEFNEGSFSATAIEAYLNAGYAVLVPGLRGHGTVAGVPAEGIEFLEAWDNGSYLSPVFYAIDVLNLLDSLDSLANSAWQDEPNRSTLNIDKSRVYITGHSQGGDAVLTALAVAGEGSSVRNQFAAGSITSGCFPGRFSQVHTYGPMASTLEAFMSGDGSWTGSAIGEDGTVNPNFVFPYPSDWIGTVNTHSPDWTWQADTWSTPSVADAVTIKFRQMYDAINARVAAIDDAEFEILNSSDGRFTVRHDPRIMQAMNAIGGFNAEQYLSEPLNLHFSDRDYYSFPAWNHDLADRINRYGGQANAFEYVGTNHGLRKSQYEWFSPAGTEDGIAQMVERDLTLFR